jgi:predicted DNA-binding ribbon-helix-helix protein
MALGEIAATQNASISEVVTVIDRDRKHDNLSSAIRLYLLDYYRQLAGK